MVLQYPTISFAQNTLDFEKALRVIRVAPPNGQLHLSEEDDPSEVIRYHGEHDEKDFSSC